MITFYEYGNNAADQIVMISAAAGGYHTDCLTRHRSRRPVAGPQAGPRGRTLNTPNMFQQLLTIARNTFTEAIRQPILTVLILVGSIGLWMNTHLAAYTFGEDNKMMIDLGLSMLFLVGLMLAAFTATGVLSMEIENRTVLTVVSKPVARPLFVVGKYLGVAAAISLTYWILTATFLLNIRQGVMETARDKLDWPVIVFALSAVFLSLLIATLGNYFYRWIFTSTFVVTYLILNTLAFVLMLVIAKRWQLQSIAAEFHVHEDYDLGQVLIALLLIFEAVMILTAVAVAVSTRLGQVMTLIICIAVFLLGLVSNSIYHEYGDAHPVASGLYWVMPNLQFLWQADALTAGHAIPLTHVAWLTLYSLLYIAALQFLSISLFQTREVG